MSTAPSASSSLAIIGMAGRFPQSPSLSEWWQSLASGRELISFFSEDELVGGGVDPATFRQSNYVPAAAVLENEDQFDAPFFGMSPREAAVTDPQLRAFLECAHQALEDAGYGSAVERPRTGVFAGCSINNYLLHNLAANPEYLKAMGGFQILFRNEKDHLPTLTSYKLNLRGPSVNIQTACSTSLVAVHLACQSVLSGECDMALAGAAAIRVPQRRGYEYLPDAISSPDGHCRVFDASAQGTVSGNGVGVVLIRRLEDAMAARDHIHAVILGSAINNDGSLKAGYTAPSIDGQMEVILEALAVSQVDPDTIACMEAHGTGTVLGDPVEIEALTDAHRAFSSRKGYCAIGSVKSNMGHLDAAAGIAGLLKMVLQLENRQIAPTLHFEQPNPKIDFLSSPFRVNTFLQEWPRDGETPRRGGVSAFGIGGTNSHVVLEEAPEAAEGSPSRSEQIVTVSAKSPEALRQLCQNLADFFRANPQVDLADAAYTLHVGREALEHRRAFVGSSAGAVSERLEQFVNAREGAQIAERNTDVVFLFPGQGSQHVHMLRGLLSSEAVFQEEFDRCAAYLLRHEGLDIRAAVYPVERSEQSEQALTSTELAQPALFAVEHAAAKLWMSWGVRPAALAGHSVGEYVAGCLAGVFSLEDALSLVAARGRLMARAPKGSMLAVSADADELRPHLNAQVSISVVNGPKMCVVSGPDPAVEELEAALIRKGLRTTRLHTSHAFHSPMMDGILEPFAARAAAVRFAAPSIPMLSNVSGSWLRSETAADPAYWVRQIREPVLFGEEIATLLAGAAKAFLEVGPSQALTSIARRHLSAGAPSLALASAPRATSAVRDEAHVHETLSRLWEAGVSVDWRAYHARESRRRIPLPTYPFQRLRHWVDPAPAKSAISDTGSAAPPMRPLEDWFYVHSWKRIPPPRPAADLTGQTWLLLDDGGPLGSRVRQAVENRGGSVIVAQAAGAFLRDDGSGYRVDPGDRGSYSELLETIEEQGRLPDVVLHLWRVGPASAVHGADEDDRRGFQALVSLGQAIGDRGSSWRPRIGIASKALFHIMGEDRVLPGDSLLLGPARVIPAELEGVLCQVVDLGAGADCDRDAERLLAELTSDASSPTAIHAYRAGRRWAPHFEAVRLGAEMAPQLRQNGVYLITGGMGGIGFSLARHLAERYRAKLILIGRSGLPPRSTWGDPGSHPEIVAARVAQVQELEALGAEVEVLAADVCDPAAMRVAYGKAHDRFGTIHGVIHAAGVPGGGLLQLKDPEAARAVLLPKTAGTRVLAELLAPAHPDFFLLCSSITSLLGGAGQVDYCAANAYLDAFAGELRRTTGIAAISVDWDPWKEVGMAFEAHLPSGLERLREENLRYAIPTRDGIEAFRRVLASDFEQVVVSTTALDLRSRAQAVSRKTDQAPADFAQALRQTPAPMAPRSVRHPLVPPRDDLDRVVASIWQEALGVAPVGIEDDFFELGGHSLLAIQINGSIRETLGAEVSLASFFQATTVASLTDRMRAAQTVPGQLEEIAEAVIAVASMSPEEVRMALADGAATVNGD